MRGQGHRKDQLRGTIAERDDGTPQVVLANTVPMAMTSAPTIKFNDVDRNMVMEWGDVRDMYLLGANLKSNIALIMPPHVF